MKVVCGCDHLSRTFSEMLDYFPSVLPVRFAGTNMASFLVLTANDSMVEDTEDFTVRLVVTQGAADLGISPGTPNTTTVEINDNDCECLVCHHCVTPMYLVSPLCHTDVPCVTPMYLVSPLCHTDVPCVTPMYLVSPLCHTDVPCVSTVSHQCTTVSHQCTPVSPLCHTDVPCVTTVSHRCTLCHHCVTPMYLESHRCTLCHHCVTPMYLVSPLCHTDVPCVTTVSHQCIPVSPLCHTDVPCVTTVSHRCTLCHHCVTPMYPVSH